MTSQVEIWNKEHGAPHMFERIHGDKPSGPLPGFATQIATEFFYKPEIRVVDVGCGKGRNTAYLAERFAVRGLDFSDEAILEARRRHGESSAVFESADLTNSWPIGDEEVDAIVDCNTTICIPNPGRDFAIAEARRTLRGGGLYFFYGVARTLWVDSKPGPEPNSTVFDNGKFEKQYSEEELVASFEGFELVSLKTLGGSDVVEGRETNYPMWVAIFRKL